MSVSWNMETVWGSLKSYKWGSDWHIRFLVMYIQAFLWVLRDNTVLFVHWLSGTDDEISDSDFERFKEETRDKGIPEENIINFIDNGNEFIFFPWLYHSPVNCKYVKYVNIIKKSTYLKFLLPEVISYKIHYWKRKKETLEILWNGNWWLLYFPHFVFPQMTVQRREWKWLGYRHFCK